MIPGRRCGSCGHRAFRTFRDASVPVLAPGFFNRLAAGLASIPIGPVRHRRCQRPVDPPAPYPRTLA